MRSNSYQSQIVETDLKNQVDEIWRVNQTKEKFIELDDMMARRVGTKRLLHTGKYKTDFLTPTLSKGTH